MDQKVLLKVDGMDCANCALTISRTLAKDGLKDVNVNFINGEVTFVTSPKEIVDKAVKTIHKLGYSVVNRSDEKRDDHQEHEHRSGVEKKFFICLIFSVPVVMHMLPISIFHNAYFQLLMSLPVVAIGFYHFGKSAFYSLRAGVPNMDVLIFIGSFAAFIYSITGMMLYEKGLWEKYLFFETSVTIITLVLLGNLIEQRSVKKTTSSIKQLGALQPPLAKKIDQSNNQDKITEVKAVDLQPGDIVLVNHGDRIPCDGNIVEGRIVVDESMLTGESLPLTKGIGENVTGGTFAEEGSIRIEVTHSGSDTVLASIIALVQNAQHSKPEIQKLGDRISAIFVPVVLLISLATFLISYFIFIIPASKSLMSSIAVLVISCPCAMGLATPTAVMVGLGRAARMGILIKGGSTIEQLAHIKTIVFDKTGTITTGKFRIKNINIINADVTEVKSILYSLEKHSSHPIAKSIQTELKNENPASINWKEIKEDKGIGINATDQEGNIFSAGSYLMVKHFYEDLSHDIYVLKNNMLIATVDLEDEIKTGVVEVIMQLKERGMRVIMLSGDRKSKCESVAKVSGIEEYYFEKLPSEKLTIIERLVAEGKTAMAGDGINDAPALTRSDVGISIGNATDIAIQSAQVILLSGSDLNILLRAFRIGEMTYQTIRQNLFWAFFYNIVAIPLAAIGWLSPMLSALSMAFSDVVVIGNSLRLRIRKM